MSAKASDSRKLKIISSLSRKIRAMLLLLFSLRIWCKSEATELVYSIVRNITIPVDGDDDEGVGCVRGFFAKGDRTTASAQAVDGVCVYKVVRFTCPTGA
jgi:hypothetical protein